MRIHHLNCGTMCVACQRLINGYGSWRKPGKLICHCLLIETPESLVLVDTGIGQADVRDPRRRLGSGFLSIIHPQLSMEETALSQVRALGYDPCDVRHIVPTHLDMDHAGGLSDFPAAKVHVFKPELEPVLKPRMRDRVRFRQPQFEHSPHWVVHEEQGDSWFGFGSIQAIPGLSTDVLLIPLVGHTRGHSGVAVRQGDKWLLHCGDAYYHHSQISSRPQAPAGLVVFEAAVQTIRCQRLRNQARLRHLAAHHGNEVELFCAHDPVELERYTGTG
ncbi:MBL fold metallo-hydrolase [Pseudomonas cavernae]|uniref:MBL fold metallo-hydrolase n=1 Tax=Pseudomonas cavernae TaxID=2320867 RepID=A0A385Z8Q4_9PSED|nr:MBL fold metallo-hydrolase [Pseudomonas cavernae]